jgi:hypothetical protein
MENPIMNISFSKVLVIWSLTFSSLQAAAVGMSVRSQGTASYTSAAGKSNSLTVAGGFSFPNWVSGPAVTTTIIPTGGSGVYSFLVAPDSIGCSVGASNGLVTATGLGACKVVVSDGPSTITVGPAAIVAANLPLPIPIQPSAPSVSCALKVCTIQGTAPSGASQILVLATGTGASTSPVAINVASDNTYSGTMSLSFANGGNYTFKVKASNSAGSSDYSDASGVTIVGGITSCSIQTNTCSAPSVLATNSESDGCTTQTTPSPANAIPNVTLDDGSWHFQAGNGATTFNGLTIAQIKSQQYSIYNPGGKFRWGASQKNSPGQFQAYVCVVRR